MDFPRCATPGMMIFVRSNRTNDRADISRAIVFVVPQEIPRDTNFSRGMPRRFDGKIGRADEAGQGLKANVVAVKGVLGSRSDLANDRRRVSDLRCVIERLFEKLEM